MSTSSVERFVAAPDGTRLYLRAREAQTPSRATAVLCDGILCDGFIWKYLWDSIAERMPVAHWNYRGHGRSASPADPDRIDIAAHAEDLEAVRKDLGNPDVVLFGHSMGCQVALEGYKIHREHVRGLVLICGSYGRVTETFKGTRLLADVLPKIIDPITRNSGIARALWSRMPADLAANLAIKLGEVDKTVNPDDLRPYMRGLTQIDFPMFLRMLKAAGEHTTEDWLEDIRCPVLVVAGKRDSFTPPYLAEEMAKKIPKAELFVVDGTHVPPIEQPELINLRVDKFLRDHVL